MKRKFGNLLMAATLVLAVGVSFTSCRDYDEELVAEMNAQAQNLEELNEQLAADKAELEAAINGILPTLEAEIEGLNAVIDGLNAEIAALKERIAALEAINHDHSNFATKEELAAAKAELDNAIAELDNAIAELAELAATKAELETVKASLDALKGEFATHVGLYNTLSATVADAVGRLSTLEGNYETLNAAVEQAQKDIKAVQNKLTEVAAQAAAADALAQANSVKIAVLEQYGKKLEQDFIATVEALRAEAAANLAEAKAYTDAVAATLAGELAATNATVAELQNALKNAVAELQDQIDVLAEELDEMDEKIEAVDERVDSLVAELAGIKETLNRQITSVSVHGAYSPVVGYFNLPTGVKSNILAAYYGEVDADFYFPTVRTANNVSAAFDEAAFNALGFVEEQIEAGVLLADGANAGKVYMTINPAEVAIAPEQLALVNSLGEESPAKILSVKPSTEKLAFGYTRDGAVALYEAEARIEDVENAKLRIELADLKDAVKDVLTVGDGVNITDVVTTLYTLVNDVADAHAVQATWTDAEGVAHTVFSDYNLAAVAIKPLSYSTFKGLEINEDIIPEFDVTVDNSSLDNVLNKVENGLYKFLDKVCANIDKFDKLLQPTMLVSTIDGFSLLSSNEAAPTVLDKAAATLVPTSFTAEILAPACKKFVAVTKAYDANGNEDLNAAKAANAGDLATVLPGDTRTVQFNGKSGYTYEITYSACDFFGYIANTKYYVRVK